MAELPAVSIAKLDVAPAGTIVVLANDALSVGPTAARLGLDRIIKRAAAASDFKAKPMAILDILAPDLPGVERVVVVGLGKESELKELDWLRLGGAAMGALRRGEAATVFAELPKGAPVSAGQGADIALGALLRAYSFDRYKRARDNDEKKKKPGVVAIAVADAARTRKTWAALTEIAKGVILARDLVNEPANILGPVEFAAEAARLETLGVDIEVLGEKEMKKLGMGALLGVAQGSPRPPRIVILKWNGGKRSDKPLAFIGKGVVFDTGGVSIKPASGMEDMKGDMAGAAAVTGLIRALAGRKARVNVVGVVGIVENSISGEAQRPGDIVTAMSGLTIEVVNTDAEGRLVLADVVAYVEKEFKPRVMIDLATLTGAVIVALGHHHAGMFSTDDDLAAALSVAGEATGEKVWRLPLGPEYDKMIDSKFADMKNVGGRDGGSITGAQFIKRFVKATPWVHLDIAGTGMGSPQTEINRSWASGFGVRLLDRLVADKYEG